MPDLVATNDDGTIKYVGKVTKVTPNEPDPDNPDVVTYTVTADSLGDEQSTVWHAL